MASSADAATRTAVRAVRALALLAIAAVVLVVFVTADDDDGNDGAPAPGVAPEVTRPPGVPALVRDLVAERSAALAGADGRHDAVVSLTSYRGADGVVRIAERAGVEVVAVLVAAPGGPPSVVTDSLAGWVEARRQEATRERDALAELLPTVGPDDPFAQVYAEDIADLDDEIAALDTGADLVYGFTTTASAEVLRELALRADVRLVDVEGLLPLGLRPEEVEVVGEPRTRPPQP